MFAISFFMCGATNFAVAPPQVFMPGCHKEFVERFDPEPAEPGPLRLIQVSCIKFRSGNFPISNVQMSPDGRSATRWHGGSPAPLEIAPLAATDAVIVPNRVSFRNFASSGEEKGTAADALAWSADSRFIWTVQQQTTSPGSWATSGLAPVTISRNGSIQSLPELRHRAGPLDALLWIGGEGRGLAQFGSRGSYYRPEHSDAAPTFAMVDAARGNILDTLPAHSVATVSSRLRKHGLRVAVSGATGTILPDGRIRSVIQFGKWGERPAGTPPGHNFKPIIHPGLWLFWTQGEQPREWINPYPDDRQNPLALSPDGSKLLVVRALQPRGIQVFDCRGCPPPPPPSPVSGPIAELVDVASRRVLWRVPAEATQFWSQSAPPAISPDGRYALIEIPPESGYLPIALIDMRDGRLMQRISPSRVGSYAHSFGFTSGGRQAWVAVGNQVFLYKLSR